MRIEIDPSGFVFKARDDLDVKALDKIAEFALGLGLDKQYRDHESVRIRTAAPGEDFRRIYTGLLESGVEVVDSVVYSENPANLPRLRSRVNPF